MNRFFVLSILICIAILVLMWQLPLFSITETRYAEFSRKMMEHQNYLVPLFSDTEIFWGKPFLPFTLNAVSLKLFGINNFAPRLSSLLELILITYITYILIKSELKKINNETFIELFAIVLSLPIILVLGTSVIVDNLLTLAVLMVMVGFWFTFVQHRNFSWLFYLGLIIGFFTKGFTIIVLAGIPIFIWCIATKNLLRFFKEFPLLLGTFIFFSLIALWLFLMNESYPGFIKYFIIEEHLARITGGGELKSGYGFFHNKPYGTSILYALLLFMPWTISLIISALKIYYDKKTQEFDGHFQNPNFLLFIVLWALSIILFFAISKHILVTYLLYILPPVSILILLTVTHYNLQKLLFGKLIFSMILLILVNVFIIIDKDKFIYSIDKGDNYFAPIIDRSNKSDIDKSLNFYSLDQTSFGLEYYSNGKIDLINNIEDIPTERFYLIAKNDVQNAQLNNLKCSLIEKFKFHSLLNCKK